ncbi:MAG: hypothetical protein U0869_18660 [Chloroflexota bacterium]
MSDDRSGGRPGERPLTDEEIEAILAEIDAGAELADADDASGLRDTRSESFGAAIGSFMAGLEQQIFQKRPPAVEVIHEVQPSRMLSGEGLEVTISLPDPVPPKPDPER